MTNRIFCGKCWKFMVKMQTGFNIRLKEDLAVRGDLYKCPECKQEIFGDFGEPFQLAEGMAEQE